MTLSPEHTLLQSRAWEGRIHFLLGLRVKQQEDREGIAMRLGFSVLGWQVNRLSPLLEH